jgi:RimJ/RimL family protein N-acetyltransferase
VIYASKGEVMTMALSLTTANLSLREFSERDWKSVHEYASDPQVVKHLLWGPNTEEDTRNFIRVAISYEQQEPRIDYELGVVLRSEDVLIGACGIHVSNLQNKEGLIGYCFNRNFWGKGYATEAAHALLDFGFKQLGLHRVSALCDPENVASARVLEKIGMIREGHLREHQWAKGKWWDSFLYAILEQEWRWRESV